MTSSLKRLLAVTLVGVAVTVACGGGPKATSSQTPPAAPPATTAAAGSAASVAPGDFGVPECDQYMRKYLACIDSKVPDMVRPTLKASLDQQKQAWKKAASTPEGKAGLAAACTQMEGQSKAAMQAYGCSW